MQQAIAGLSGERAVFAAARAYLDYATSESSFYNIMMQSCNTPSQASEPTKQLWNFFVRLASDTTQLGEDVSGAAALWSFLHGFIVLSGSGQLNEAAPKLIFARGIQALVRGLAVADADAVRAQS